VMNRSGPLMETLGGAAVGLLLIYGGYQVLILDVPPGQFVSFIAAFLLAYEPGKRIARLNVDLSNAIVGFRTLFDTLDLPEHAADSGLPTLSVSRGRITFSNVT